MYKVILCSLCNQQAHHDAFRKIYIYISWVKIIFPQSCLHYQHTCFIFACGAVCRWFKTLCWSVWALRFSACHFLQNIVRMCASGGQKHGSLWVLNWDCKEGEGEQSTPLLQVRPSCTDCCVAWRFHAAGGLDSSYSWADAFQFVVVTSFMSAQGTVIPNQCINHVFGLCWCLLAVRLVTSVPVTILITTDQLRKLTSVAPYHTYFLHVCESLLDWSFLQ